MIVIRLRRPELSPRVSERTESTDWRGPECTSAEGESSYDFFCGGGG